LRSALSNESFLVIMLVFGKWFTFWLGPTPEYVDGLKRLELQLKFQEPSSGCSSLSVSSSTNSFQPVCTTGNRKKRTSFCYTPLRTDFLEHRPDDLCAIIAHLESQHHSCPPSTLSTERNVYSL
jgi:hypothetical protein